MNLSIIIPHHRNESDLGVLLNSISKQRVNFSFEALVISNPSSQRAKKICDEYSFVRHFDLNETGVNRARNLGVKKALGQVLLFLDCDCALEDNELLSKHLQIHIQYPDICCLGGVYENTSKAYIDRTYNFLQMTWLYKGIKGSYSSYLIGGHFSCKSSEISGWFFDDNIAYGSSETDLFVRLSVAGKKFRLFKDLKVQHRSKLSLISLTQKLFRQGYGTKYIETKTHTSLADSSINFHVIDFQQKFYDSKMDFYILLSDKAFNLGHNSSQPRLNYRDTIGLISKTYIEFSFSHIWGLAKSLEFLLKNFPKR